MFSHDFGAARRHPVPFPCSRFPVWVPCFLFVHVGSVVIGSLSAIVCILHNKLLLHCRYWCNTPTPEVSASATALNPAGNAFKLSDKELVVIKRAAVAKRLGGGSSKGKRGRGTGGEEATVVLGPSVECHNETDIFKAVGLNYVPPHMRDLLS